MGAFRNKLTALAFFLTGAVVALILTFSNNWIPVSVGEVIEGPPVAAPAEAPPAVDEKTLDAAEALGKAVEQVAASVSPAVAHISTSKTIRTPRNQPPFGDDFFDRFFRRRMPREYKRTALGSGIIVSSDGYILTNNHVVSGADELKVTLSDKREFIAQVKGADPETEVAVIKIDAKDLPCARMGNSDKIRVGQWVIAIGNPFGFDRTVTFGIVSAKGRSLGMQTYEDFIQTDAAINPGNSGGPLVNIRGEVIGINTAIVSRTGGYQGLGFAIPINMAKSVMDSLLNEGRVVRGFLGVQPQDVDDDLARALGLDSREGSLVAGVVPGTAADRAGIKNGDVIMSLDGHKIRNSDHLRNVVARTPVNKDVDVVLNRKGKTITLKASIGDRTEVLSVVGSMEKGVAANDLGFAVAENTPEIRERYGIKLEEGVVITEVRPGSPAAAKEIKPGTVILEIEQESVNNLEEYNKQMKDVDPKKRVLLRVNQDDRYRYVSLKAK